MGNKILLVITTILIFGAIGLGYAIYKQRVSEPPDTLFENRFDNNKEKISESLPSSQNTELKNIQPTSQPILPSAEELGITEDELAAINTPAKDAPIEEKQRHFELVQKIAKVAPILDITKCEVANPVVLQVNHGETITVKNRDTVAHTIVFDPENTFTIPAGTTKDIQPVFEYGAGTYGYGCDQVPHGVGIFMVMP